MRGCTGHARKRSMAALENDIERDLTHETDSEGDIQEF